MTISLRLDDKLARKLERLARARGMSKSELIRQCLLEYFEVNDQRPTPWELGKDLFGCYKSGQGDLSARAKEIMRERIHGKRAKNNRS
jgi:hypothetical protein